MKDHSDTIVKSKEVVGVAVKNADKEDLGKIEEIVLNKLTGQVHYVVLSYGGFLGIKDKYFAVPWKAISYSPEEGAFMLKVNKEKVANAPSFDKDHWPDFAQNEWTQNLETYYL